MSRRRRTVDLQAVRRRPLPDLVAGLEDLLAAAASGEVRGLAVAYVVSGEEVRTWVDPGDCHFADLFLAVAQLQRSMLGVDDE